MKYNGENPMKFPFYLKELEFRYNHRDGDLFNDLLQVLVSLFSWLVLSNHQKIWPVFFCCGYWTIFAISSRWYILDSLKKIVQSENIELSDKSSGYHCDCPHENNNTRKKLFILQWNW